MPPYRYFGPFAELWIPTIGYVLYEKADRQPVMERASAVADEYMAQIAEVPQTVRRKACFCFVGFARGQISHVARAEIRYKARTGNDRIDLWKIEKLPQPISAAKLRAALKGSRLGTAKEALKNGGHLPPAAFASVLEALKEIDPEAAQIADSLYDREGAVDSPVPVQARVNWVLQRDAVVTALDIAKIPREEMSVPAQAPEDTRRAAISIFDDIQDVRGLEDILVLHDLDGAEGWSFLKAHRYPAKTFQYQDTVLTVILANKLPLEEQLGMDLIYVNETLKSVVFVQYKVMKGADGEDGYRPDGQLDVELERMDDLSTILSKAAVDVSCNGYRLSDEVFFLKFCKGVLEHRDAGMVPGYYLPVGFWKRLAPDPRLKGPRGGIKVTPASLPRYLTATEFKDLVARAWIGTSALRADIIIPLIKMIWRSKRAVTLAIKSNKPETHPELGDLLTEEDLEDAIGSGFRRARKRRPGQKPKVVQI
jgi:hypothetical protein